MPSLKIPTPLRPYTMGQGEILVEGQNIAEAMHSLLSLYPDLRPHLYNAAGELRPFANIFLKGDNGSWGNQNRNLQGLDTPLEENDQLMVVLSIAGG